MKTDLKPIHPENGRPTRPVMYGLLGFTAVALFPYGWLAEVWPAFATAVNGLFGNELAHVAGHLAIFFLLGIGLLLAIPYLQRRPHLYLLLILGLGWAQEWLQLFSFKQRPFAFADFFDLGVDLLAGLLAWLGWSYWRRRYGYNRFE